MDNMRAKIIAEIIKHLEGMDADGLSSKMVPSAAGSVEIEIEGGAEGQPPMEKGPMEVLAEKGTDPVSEMPEKDNTMDEEMTDEELAELEKLGM